MLVTYTALREIEPTGFSKSGTDLSVVASDDSFNSVSTNLSGVANNDWILSAGFATAGNNGWFQSSGASTSTKIVQDTTISLTDEAAGESVTIKGYKRGLGQSYSLEVPAGTSSVSAIDRAVAVTKKAHTSIGGNRETILQRQDVDWTVRIEYLDRAAILQWREFLASVSAGEPFTLDPYGSLASPDMLLTVQLDDEGFGEERHGASLLVAISFKVREI
jgi:hypothetical protein